MGAYSGPETAYPSRAHGSKNNNQIVGYNDFLLPPRCNFHGDNRIPNTGND